MDALATACVKKGYAATTVSDIVQIAGTSRQAMYDEFPNKSAVAVALLEDAYEELFAAMGASCAMKEGFGAVAAGLATLLDWVERNPPAARACFVERFDVPRAAELQSAARERFIAMLGARVPSDARRPGLVDEVVVGGVETLVRYRLVAGEGDSASAMLPSVLSFVRQPYEHGWR